jgi:hypothetical protein
MSPWPASLSVFHCNIRPSPRRKLSLYPRQQKQTQITVDLGDQLLFPYIDWFQYTLVQRAGDAVVASSASPPNGTQLIINLASAAFVSAHVVAMQCM